MGRGSRNRKIKIMSYIDQREPGIEWEKQNPNWTNRFKNKQSKYVEVEKTNYNFKNIKSFPETRDDVLFPHLQKLNFSHRMDALKHCNDNKIPFLWWNDIMYDLEGNRIDIGYYDLPKTK